MNGETELNEIIDEMRKLPEDEKNLAKNAIISYKTFDKIIKCLDTTEN